MEISEVIMKKLKLAAVCTFGLEAIVKRECMNLGFENIKVDNGWVYFDGTEEDIAKANINLRCAERIMLILGQFEVKSFTELFDSIYALPIEEWIDEDGKFIINGKSVKSKLSSVPAIQASTEKAIVEKLKTKYETEWFSKLGADYSIWINIRADKATFAIDTTGAREGLFKRGYREISTIAPLKETMAAALVSLSYWNPDRILFDPMCGSGTIAIEAALIGKNIAPGLKRNFAAEKWSNIDASVWENARSEARDKINPDKKLKIYASDVSEKAVSIAKNNAVVAGVDDVIEFSIKDIFNIKKTDFDYGILITNPPYGDRIGDAENIPLIHKQLGELFGKNKTWSSYIITSNETFEREFGRKADRKRKLFNGNVKVNYYQYYGERPSLNV